MIIRPSRRAILAAALSAPAYLREARAQGGITRFVVGVAAGGGMDATARIVAEQVRDRMGAVIIENKAGAAMRLALNAVKLATPDGATLYYGPSSPFTIYPHVYRRLGYDPDADMMPVAPTVTYDFAIAVRSDSPAATLADYLDAVRRDEPAGRYAIPAIGASPHILGEALGKLAKVRMTSISYRGSAPAMQDLLGGHVPACVNVLGDFLSLARDGKVRILAMSGRARSPLAPEAPTFAELGFPSLAIDEQFGLYAPARTPAETVARINAEVSAAMAKPDARRRIADLGYVAEIMTPPDFAEKLRRDRGIWQPLVKSSGFVIED